MLLARGKAWMASLSKGADSILLTLQKDGLSGELQDLRDLKLEVPVGRWNSVVKQIVKDRKLLGGILLACANQTEHVAAAVGSDRLYFDLQRLVLEATAALVAEEVLSLAPSDGDAA
ncbi:MAG: hypothetical protein JSU66_03425 [Deltaproteobacteria bacterium]|nr:MAG: hypothetical protein JSU66_03425 [Deltaproteobacteria bacterium]